MKLSKFTNIIKIEKGIIVHNAIYNSCIRVYSEECINLVENLKENSNVILDFNTPFVKDLVDLKLIVSNNHNEENILTYYSNISERKNDFTLVVTKQCNFRCPYCYEDHTNDVMTWETYNNSLKFMESTLRTSDSKRGVLSFFGGEPLLEYKNIIKFMKEFKNMLLQIDDKKTWTNHITTNAYLLDLDMAKQLAEVGINSYQITIDGLKENHDKSRYLVGKYGTWDKIINNLKEIKNSSLNAFIQIRMNYTKESLKSMDEYMSFLKNNFDDPRFHFYFEAVKDFGVLKETDDIEVCKNESEYEEYVVGLAKDRGLKLAIAKNQCYAFNLECYAANYKSFVIDYDGSIEKCTVLLNNNERNILGNVNNVDNYNFNIEKLANWTSYKLKEECLDCSVVAICNGRKCPSSYMSMEKIDVSYCDIIKKLYEESVKLNYA
jgi:uncharacterized protein